MGLSPFKKSSFSSYDKTDNCYVAPTPPNPDPSRFHIENYLTIEDYLIIEVKYPDCTNYEGRKLLVYEGADVWTLLLKNNDTIDPHFSNNPNFQSPIARFEPTERGWEMAKCFVYAYLKILRRKPL